MSARLISDMEAKATSLRNRCDLYRAAGERSLANTAHAASMALFAAVEALNRHDERAGEAQTEQETH